MTDREPNDLYDALRDRLADYGQEPPAPLWANIRAQLPPPVAVPQRRPRARRVARLALLLLLLSVGTWGGWQLAHFGSAPKPGQAHRAPASAPVADGASVAIAPALPGEAHSETTAHLKASSPVISSPSAASATIASGAQKSSGASSPAALAAPATAARAAIAAARPPADIAANTPKPNRTATAAALHARQPGNAPLPHSRAEPAGYSPGSGALTRPAASAATAAKGLAGASAGQAAGARAGAARTTALATTASRASGPMGSASSGSRLAATSPVAGTTPGRARQSAAGAPAPGSRLAYGPTLTPGVAGQQQPAITAEPVAAAAAATMPRRSAENQAEAAGENQLARRLAQLPLAAWPAPLVKVSSDTLPRLPRVAGRRWMLQAVAGPALTHRFLGSRQGPQSPQPSINVPPSSPTNTGFTSPAISTYSVEREQAAAGFGAEVQVQYQRTGRWGFSTGLGYHEYATRQEATIISHQAADQYRPDSLIIKTIHLHDTYRFLTLPLRLSYQLGPGSARWRYGLLAGADVAFYLGGTSAEGSGGITSRQWGSSGNPYRSLNLSLSLGAEVRYRLAPRWELLAQPTATLFVNSLGRPASGYVARYPLAASALLGVAYGLR